jgi:hypothetical protein
MGIAPQEGLLGGFDQSVEMGKAAVASRSSRSARARISRLAMPCVGADD